MIDEKFIELMNRDLDGVISPSEQAALRTYLDSNEEARRYYAELLTVNERLRNVPRVDAPAGLRHTIMSQVPTGQRLPVTASSAGFFRKFSHWFIPSPSLYVASGIVAGALVMAVAISFFARNEVPSMNLLSGTMMPASESEDSVVDRQIILDGQTKAVAETIRWGNKLVVLVSVDGTSDVVVRITFDKNDLAMTGFHSTRGTLETVQKDANSIIVGAIGPQAAEFTFRDLTSADSKVVVYVAQGSLSGSQELKTGISEVPVPDNDDN